MPDICMISPFGFWHPSGHFNNMLLEYIKGYAQNGYHVLLIGTIPENAETFPSGIQGKVEAMPLCNAFSPFRWFAENCRGDRPEASRRVRSGLDETAPEGVMPILGARRVLNLKFALEVVITVQKALRKDRRPDFFYGIGTPGAVAAFLCGKLFGGVTVTRYMGTFSSYPFIRKFGKRKFFFRYPDVYLGARLPTDLFISTDDGTKADLLLAMLGQPQDKIKHWINGAPDHPELLELPRERVPVFVSVSRLVPWKRLDRVIRAFARVAKVIPHARLKVIGDGPMSDRLRELSRNLNLQNQVVLPGRLGHLEAMKEIRRAWAVVCAYDMSNMTNQVLEALAMGTPVITLDDGSTASLLRDGTNALLVDPLKPIENLGEAMLKLVKMPDLQQSLSIGASRTADEKLMSWPERMKMEIETIGRLSKSAG